MGCSSLVGAYVGRGVTPEVEVGEYVVELPEVEEVGEYVGIPPLNVGKLPSSFVGELVTGIVVDAVGGLVSGFDDVGSNVAGVIVGDTVPSPKIKAIE